MDPDIIAAIHAWIEGKIEDRKLRKQELLLKQQELRAQCLTTLVSRGNTRLSDLDDLRKLTEDLRE